LNIFYFRKISRQNWHMPRCYLFFSNSKVVCLRNRFCWLFPGLDLCGDVDLCLYNRMVIADFWALPLKRRTVRI